MQRQAQAPPAAPHGLVLCARGGEPPGEAAEEALPSAGGTPQTEGGAGHDHTLPSAPTSAEVRQPQEPRNVTRCRVQKSTPVADDRGCAVVLRCSHCQQVLQLRAAGSLEELRGRHVQCGACSNMMLIVGPSSDSLPPAAINMNQQHPDGAAACWPD